MLKEMQQGIKKKDMQSSMQGLLCKMQLCTPWYLWQQGGLSLLCQIEDQKKQAQMPMNKYIIIYLLRMYTRNILSLCLLLCVLIEKFLVVATSI